MIEDQIADLKGLPPDPVTMRRLFLLLTRLNFSDPKHYGSYYEKQLSNIVYSDAPEERTLGVDLLSIYAPSKTFSRPAVFVGFGGGEAGGIKFDRVSVADFAGMSADNSRTYRVKMVGSTLKIVHTAKDPDQALALCTISATYFMGIQGILLRTFGLIGFSVEGMSDATLVEKSPDSCFSCTLTASVHYEYEVSAALESHRIKKFTDTLDALT